jgi:hypothetical protein
MYLGMKDDSSFQVVVQELVHIQVTMESLHISVVLMVHKRLDISVQGDRACISVVLARNPLRLDLQCIDQLEVQNHNPQLLGFLRKDLQEVPVQELIPDQDRDPGQALARVPAPAPAHLHLHHCRRLRYLPPRLQKQNQN